MSITHSLKGGGQGALGENGSVNSMDSFLCEKPLCSKFQKIDHFFKLKSVAASKMQFLLKLDDFGDFMAFFHKWNHANVHLLFWECE